MWVSLFDAARYSSHYKLHVYMLTFFTVIEFWQHHHKYKLRVLWVICSTLPSPHNTHTLSLSLSLSLLLSLSLSSLSLSLPLSPCSQTTVLNKYLQEQMEGLTAKVFRTYNASITLQEQLEELTVGKSHDATS